MPGPRGLVQLLDQRLHWEGFPRGAGGGAARGRVGLLVAVSGGADSVALLRLMAAVNGSAHWNWRLVVGHVDHGLRGAASRGDARFVAGLAKELGLACVVRRVKLARGASEDAARQARFGALERMCRSKKCAAVVMAHHADDQAETVLMRLFRGTGVEGLAGIGARSAVGRLTILRPLLGFRRQELREYLEEIGQAWREDASNASGRYLRNRVRHTLMPLVNVLWPRGVEAVGRAAALAGEAQAAIEAAARTLMDTVPAWSGRGFVQVPREALADSPGAVASEVLRQMVAGLGGAAEEVGMEYERIAAALAMVRRGHGGKHIQLGGGVSVSLRGGLVRVERKVKG